MMKNYALHLSLWAKRRRFPAVTLLICCKILLGSMAFVLGTGTALNGFVLPAWFQWPLAVAVAAGLSVYPLRSMKARLGKVPFYRRQKCADASLAAIGFAGIFFLGNLFPAWTPDTQPEALLSQHSPSALSCVRGTPGGWTSVERQTGLGHYLQHNAKARVTQKLLKWQEKFGRINTAGQIALTVLTILVALLLAYLIAVLACSVACSGSEALAVLIGVGGALGIIWGAIVAFRTIWKNPGVDRKQGVDRRHQKQNK